MVNGFSRRAFRSNSVHRILMILETARRYLLLFLVVLAFATGTNASSQPAAEPVIPTTDWSASWLENAIDADGRSLLEITSATNIA